MIYRQYDRLFAVNETVKQWVVDQKLAAPNNVETILNGIDLLRFNCSDKKMAIRDKFGFSKNDIIILNIGSLTEQKNQSNLIHAISHFRKRNTQFVRLLIAGDGPLKNLLHQKVKELNLERTITLLGCRDDIPELLRAADLFIFPSLWEGLPIALLEAIASGTPVAVSKIDAHTSVFTDGISGYLIDGNGPEHISEAIDYFIKNRKLCISKAEKSKKLVNRKYSSVRMANDYLNTYHKVINAD
jgi:glycosyltransferase involved in cell wall biosynthesis